MANYLYNGIELPELPEWDKASYPYAMITEGTVLNYGKYFLYCAVNPIIESLNGYGEATGYVKINGNYLRTGATAEGADSWGEFTEVTSTDKLLTNTPPLWTNTDIYYRDGSLYLAASDPVPVTVLTARDLYRKINGKPTKLTLYKKLGGKLIPLDEHTKEVKT